MSRHVILQVGCRRTRFLANVALVSANVISISNKLQNPQ